MQGLGLDPVHLDVELRHHRTERRADALQRALRLCVGDDGAGDGLQLAEVGIAVAQLDLHGETGGVADALDRRRRDHQNPRFLDRRHLLVQPDEQRSQILARAARAPLLQDQIGDARHWRGSSELSSAEMPAMLITCSTPGRLAGEFADLVEHALGAVERRAIGQLHGHQQVALILDRNEAGRHPRQAVAGDADQDEGKDDRHIAVRDQAADQPGYSRARPGHRPR